MYPCDNMIVQMSKIGLRFFASLSGLCLVTVPFLAVNAGNYKN